MSLFMYQLRAGVIGALIGAVVMFLAQVLTGCSPAPDLAAYSVEQAACVERANTREESRACRASSKAAWHARWCDAGYPSYCTDGGTP